MTTWEERVAHLSERWATSSRPHRNPPPLPSFRLSPESTRPRRHPPPRPPHQTNPTPKITQIKRITVEAALVAAQAPPNLPSHPRAPHPSFRRKPETTYPQLSKTPSPLQPNGNSHPSRLSGESRKPRNPNSQEQPGNTSLTATPTPPVIPTKAGNHATPTPRNSPATPAELQLSPHPSFRRKPESTYPQLSKTPSPLQPNGNSHPSRHSNESRKPRNPNSQEQPGNTSRIAALPTPVFPAKAGIHVPPTLKDTKPTPA